MGNDEEAPPSPQVAPSAATVIKRPKAEVAQAQVDRAAKTAEIVAPPPVAISTTRFLPNGKPFNALYIHPGDVLWVEVPPSGTRGHEQAKARPWVVVSANRAHKRELDLVNAVPLTRKVHKVGQFREARMLIPAAQITSFDPRFLAENCLALTEHTRSISLDRCDALVGKFGSKALNAVMAAVRSFYDF